MGSRTEDHKEVRSTFLGSVNGLGNLGVKPSFREKGEESRASFALLPFDAPVVLYTVVMAHSALASEPTVRYAEEKDVPLILSIIQDLALYEKEPDSCLATAESLLKTLSFGNNPSKGYARTLLIFSPPSSVPQGIAGPQPECAGMALYFNNYSTWRAAPGIYLEDLFVRPEYRGRGYGKKLLQELAREVKKIGGTRLEWSVLRWNQPSINFYEGLGARKLDEWWGMRVDHAALDKMAEGEGLERG